MATEIARCGPEHVRVDLDASALSRDAIVRAAITLADTDGLGAVSLRKVAAALDAGPMRLYGYLSTKQELLDLMVDAVYGEIMRDEPGGVDWRSALGPNALAYLEAALSTLDGVPDPACQGHVVHR